MVFETRHTDSEDYLLNRDTSTITSPPYESIKSISYVSFMLKYFFEYQIPQYIC